MAAEEEAASAPTHGEASSCRTVARSRGSGARRSRTTARASGETEAHSVLLQPSYLWARMARLSARSSAMPAGSKGWYPTRRRYLWEEVPPGLKEGLLRGARRGGEVQDHAERPQVHLPPGRGWQGKAR